MDIKEYLEKKKVTGKEFADKLGINHFYLYQLISGKRKVSMELALKMEKISKGHIKAKEIFPELPDYIQVVQ